jgi:FG-GAP-like repeat
LVDIDGDGHLDILSGSYSQEGPGRAGLFYVLYGKGDGTFRKPEVLKGTDGQPLTIPRMGGDTCTRPFAVDWDGDGHLDLVVGNQSGTFYWFQGEGNGRFWPKPETIKSGWEPLRLLGVSKGEGLFPRHGFGCHGDPFVVDWDGDGALDLISGSSNGGVQWARNRAGKGTLPVLEPFEWLIRPDTPVEYGQLLSEEKLTGPTYCTRVWVADVNGDGKLDLLVGDSVTLVSPANGVSTQEFKRRLATWQKAIDTVSTESESADEVKRAQANEEFKRIYMQRYEFTKEEKTGFVWFYLQK